MNDMAVIQGHGGVGVVEAVGPEVRRVRVGDRVCVSGTPQCGSCYHCLRGRSDMCQFLSAIGADDVLGIKTYIYNIGDGVIEFLAIGTAVKRIEGIAPYSEALPVQAIGAAADDTAARRFR